jgi:hypothetical protein
MIFYTDTFMRIIHHYGVCGGHLHHHNMEF